MPKLAWWVAPLLLLGACTATPHDTGAPPADALEAEAPEDDAGPSGLIGHSYQAADNLLLNLRLPLEADKQILTTSIANIDDLESSSTFGRIVAEQIGSRISQYGYRVSEIKTGSSFLIRERSGEFILSREVSRLNAMQNAGSVIAGTYAVGFDAIYVNVRLIRVSDSRVLAAHDFSIPVTMDVRRLITIKPKLKGRLS